MASLREGIESEDAAKQATAILQASLITTFALLYCSCRSMMHLRCIFVSLHDNACSPFHHMALDCPEYMYSEQVDDCSLLDVLQHNLPGA